MDLEFEPPKYRQILQEIHRRIVEGVYPPGAKLPSEAQLMEEFDAARPTVVRPLQMLQQEGMITRRHGVGSFAAAAPAAAGEPVGPAAEGLAEGLADFVRDRLAEREAGARARLADAQEAEPWGDQEGRAAMAAVLERVAAEATLTVREIAAVLDILAEAERSDRDPQVRAGLEIALMHIAAAHQEAPGFRRDWLV